MPYADRFKLEAAGVPVDTRKWLENYGYKCAVSPYYAGVSGAVLFSRGDDPVKIAYVGDTLRWDGYLKAVVIERGEQ